MIRALTCAAILALSGCATVSMVSTDAVVESDVSPESAALAESAEAFNTRAEARGWIGASRSWMEIATNIFGGNSGDGASGSYPERIGAGEDDPERVLETIRADADAALAAFTDVQTQADLVLSSGNAQRADLINFETALVTAQKAYRGFSKATGLAAGRSNSGLDETEAALNAFAVVIDNARNTADTLADAYAMTGDSASS